MRDRVECANLQMCRVRFQRQFHLLSQCRIFSCHGFCIQCSIARPRMMNRSPSILTKQGAPLYVIQSTDHSRPIARISRRWTRSHSDITAAARTSLRCMPPETNSSTISTGCHTQTGLNPQQSRIEGHLRPHRERKHHPFWRLRARRGRRGMRESEVGVEGRSRSPKFRDTQTRPVWLRWACVWFA